MDVASRGMGRAAEGQLCDADPETTLVDPPGMAVDQQPTDHANAHGCNGDEVSEKSSPCDMNPRRLFRYSEENAAGLGCSGQGAPEPDGGQPARPLKVKSQ